MTVAQTTPRQMTDPRAVADALIIQRRAHLLRTYPNAARFVVSFEVWHTGYGEEATWLIYELRDTEERKGLENCRDCGPVVQLPHVSGEGHATAGRCEVCTEAWAKGGAK